MARGTWQATVHEAARVGHDLATKPPHHNCNCVILGMGISNREG